MAILQETDTDYGTQANYHRPQRLMIDFNSGAVSVEMATYVSAAARLMGKAPISSYTVPLRLSDVSVNTYQGVASEVYELVKEWRAAQPEDCNAPLYHLGEEV